MLIRLSRVAHRVWLLDFAGFGEHRRAVEPRGFGAEKGMRWTTRPGRPASTPLTTARTSAGGAGGRHIIVRVRGDAGGTDISGPIYAALDLGTNNCRLLVARPTGERFRVIDAFSRIIRLGEGITGVRPI